MRGRILRRNLGALVWVAFLGLGLPAFAPARIVGTQISIRAAREGAAPQRALGEPIATLILAGARSGGCGALVAVPDSADCAFLKP